MGLTNFPNGITSFGIPVMSGGATIPTTTGKYFFVDSNTGNDVSTAGTKDSPFDTIEYAIGQCTASKGDVIIAMPGHVETLTAAGQLTFDVIGVTLVGLGSGNLRPRIDQGTATTADVDITAADVTIRNIVFQSILADVAASVDLDAKRCWFDSCEWKDSAANLNYVDYIVTGGDNTCDGLKITGCRAISPDTANDGFINATGGDIDELVLVGNYIALGVATTEPVIEVTGKSLTNAVVTHNFIQRFNESGIVFVDSDQTDNTGIFAYNLIASDDDDSATPFDVTGASCFENYQMGEKGADASGLLLPAVDDNA